MVFCNAKTSDRRPEPKTSRQDRAAAVGAGGNRIGGRFRSLRFATRAALGPFEKLSGPGGISKGSTGAPPRFNGLSVNEAKNLNY